MKKYEGITTTSIGFLLSPSSWWHGIFINIPFAYLFATVMCAFCFCEDCFITFMLIGYWFANIIGFILMHHGIVNLISIKGQKSARCEVVKCILISIVYTAAIIGFWYIGWLRHPSEYFI